jgi:NAD(P)-dependent dehydrogenase (short-subunit alcohol dehydrogenase family)/pimeloyl-ACP methyl ester carboxylesterase
MAPDTTPSEVQAHPSIAAAYDVVEHFIDRDGVRIAYYEQGKPDGETIVLAHGWPDSHHLWDAVSTRLRDRFRLVAIDNRGHGASDNPRSFRDFRIDELAADYLAVIDAVSPDRPVHVVAHDWGSVAMWEAVCTPGAEARIASFTSVSGPSIDHMSTWGRRRLARPTPRNLTRTLAQLASVSYTLFMMTPLIPNVFFRAWLNEPRWRRNLARFDGTPPANVTLNPQFVSDAARGLRIYRANVFPALLRPRERRTQVPVQIIVGHRDGAVRSYCFDDEPQWADQVWRRVVHGGHWLPFSHPGLIADSAVELIDTVSGTPAPRDLLRAAMTTPSGHNPGRFANQLVVITGAGSGIGRETARTFARAGAEIALSDVDLAAAKATAALIGEDGGVAHAYQLDVSDATAIDAHAAHVLTQHGVPDVLINNAGVGAAGDFLSTTSEEFNRVLGINLFGVVNGCRAFAPAMVERGLGGQIVNLSSMAAFGASRGFSAYSTSKSAVFMFSDCLRADLAGTGIGVSTICPGVVHTNIVATSRISGVSKDEEDRLQRLGDRAYKARHYGPDKVAKHIFAAVESNRQVVPVTPEAHLQYRLNRLAPALVRFLGARGGVMSLAK